MPLTSVSLSPPRGGAAAGSEFAPLLRLVRERGLLARCRVRYAVEITVNALALAAVVAGMAAFGGSWWVLALAVPLALLSGRTAFIGHDAGHQQIARSRRVNRLLGLLHGDLLLGLGFAWWNDKHNRHHAHPNHVGKDPDVEVGALVWTRAQAVDRAGFALFLTKYQAWLFFPLTLLEGLALKVASVRDLARLPRGERWTEGALLTAHAVGYVALLAWAMPPGIAVAFAVLHHALFGLHLGASFAPNHKGMEMPGDGERHRGHLRRQVLTSRNVTGGPVADWLLGGLNHQVEHHLFPSMPRYRLRRAQPLVREYCARVGVPYTQESAARSYRQALAHLHAVGAPLRAAKAGAGGRSASPLGQ